MIVPQNSSTDNSTDIIPSNLTRLLKSEPASIQLLEIIPLKDLFFTGSAWCAYRNQTGEWIQVSLSKSVIWQGVRIQGRYDADMWAKTITIEVSDDGSSWNAL